MELSWRPGFSLSRKPMKNSRSRRNDRLASIDPKRHKQFEFIVEQPTSKDGSGHRKWTTTSVLTDVDGKSPLTCHMRTPADAAQARSKADEGFANPDEIALWVFDHPTWTESRGPSILEYAPGTTELRPPNQLDDTQCASLPSRGSPSENLSPSFDVHDVRPDTHHERSSLSKTAYPSSTTVLSRLNRTRHCPVEIPQNVLYNSIAQRFKPILDRYNGEFCKIPLTSDLQVNPFQYRADVKPEPTFLVHAAMALAGHHVDSTSMQYHRLAALQLLRESLARHCHIEDGHSILDTIVMLFSLEETQCLLGNWGTHLKGAYSLLEACGGIENWATSARARVQIGILTWWDAITSLLSREDPVFPYAYFDAVVPDDDTTEWGFFGLCGCPTSLVKVVMLLARLSAEKHRLTLATHDAISDAAIQELEQSLESWHHVSNAAAFQNEESMQQEQDRMHCSEAWRHGLFLYIYRVFHWMPGQRVPAHILYRARAILDHVVACREESMVSRQALLPLFFAGCELRDRSVRRKILEFCSVWNDRTRYHMFGATKPLLEEVWVEQDAKGFENVWWGQIVDRKHKTTDQDALQLRICFG